MKKIIVIIIFTCFSCQEKQVKNPCREIEKKYDSILNINNEYNNLVFNQFYKILKKENGTLLDSTLINNYKKIEGKDNLVDLYIWDRIHSINQNITASNVYEEFKGDYQLKPNHNKKYAQVTKIKIENDSCFMFKNSSLIIKDEFKIINSSDKFVKGKLKIKNFKISLLDFSSKAILINDNNCMDCEELQFSKIN